MGSRRSSGTVRLRVRACSAVETRQCCSRRALGGRVPPWLHRGQANPGPPFLLPPFPARFNTLAPSDATTATREASQPPARTYPTFARRLRCRVVIIRLGHPHQLDRPRRPGPHLVTVWPLVCSHMSQGNQRPPGGSGLPPPSGPSSSSLLNRLGNKAPAPTPPNKDKPPSSTGPANGGGSTSQSVSSLPRRPPLPSPPLPSPT